MSISLASTLTVGDTRITLIRAGTHLWDGGAFFGVVPKTLWSKHVASDDLNRVLAGFNCFVIETDGKRLLVETGGGVRHDNRWRERTGMMQPVVLAEALSNAGFPAESFDVVINTHLHWDHCGGNTRDVDGSVVPTFPNAQYVVQRGEVEHARERHPRDSVSYHPVNYQPLIDSGHMKLLDGDGQITPLVEVRVVPGHNRNMMVVLVHDGTRTETWCHLADLAPFSAHVTPTWVAGFDLFPLETIDNKRELLGRAAAESWWLSFGHDPSVAFAKIEVLEGKWQVQQSRP